MNRISSAPSADKDAFLEPDAEKDEQNINEYLDKLGFFRRLFLFLKAVFTQRDSVEILEEELLDRLGRSISEEYPGMFDHRSMMFGTAFVNRTDELVADVDALREPLKTAMVARRSAFVAFLVSIILPDIHERIVAATDPDRISDSSRGQGELEIRRNMQNDFQNIIGEITEEQRTLVYGQMRALYFLKELVLFPFARLTAGSSKTVGGVPAKHIKSDLEELGDILASQGAPPSEETLKAVVAFSSAGDKNTAEEEGRPAIGEKYTELIRVLQLLKSFTRSVPIGKVLKILNENMGHKAEPVGGGEDWFTLFRQYWEGQIDKSMEIVVFRNKRDRYLSDARRLLNDQEPIPFDHYQSEAFEEAVPVRYENTAGFVKSFRDVLYQRELARPLRKFLMDGEFYKQQNREDFTDALNEIETSIRDLERLDDSLASGGEKGRAVEYIRREMVGSRERRRRIMKIVSGMETDVEEAVSRFMDAIGLLINVVKGILYGEGGGKYDTISNMAYIGGSENARLVAALDKGLQNLEEARRIVHDVYDLEKGLDL